MSKIADAKVSIITCFLNVSDYLEETIQSVLQQDYEDWELLLIDDGSTDGSTSIAKKHADAHPSRIFYFEHAGRSNKGASESRNVGIKKAKGEFIAFLDGDDVWLPEYLSGQLNIMQQQNVAMVCEATKYWYDWNDPQKQNNVLPVGAKADRVYLPPQLMLDLYPLGTGAAPCICGIVVKKEILEKHDGFDSSFKGMYDDQVLLTKIYLNEPVYISSVCNNLYRQRPGSLVASSRNYTDYHTIRNRYLVWLENYLKTEGIKYPEVFQLLHKALLPPPLVSVVIAYLNEEKFLEDAVQSVIRQDYPHWELILVDDGSTDGSRRIVEMYTEQFPGQVFYTEHPGHANKGLSASRNLGISKARGELVAFLDADDVWLPGKLSHQVSVFKSHPEIGMVAEASKYWYSWEEHPVKNDKVIHVGSLNVKNNVIPVYDVQDRVFDAPELMLQLYPLGSGAAPCPSGLMVKKEAINQVGGFEESFTTENQLYEDQAFLSKIYLNHKVYLSSGCNNLYRQRPESIVKWVKAEGHYAKVRRNYLEWLEAYMAGQNLNHPALSKSLTKAFMPYRRPVLYFLSNSIPEKAFSLAKRTIPGALKQMVKENLH